MKHFGILKKEVNNLKRPGGRGPGPQRVWARSPNTAQTFAWKHFAAEAAKTVANAYEMSAALGLESTQ